MSRKEEGARSDVERLESLWGGAFGNEYIERNRGAAASREPFWRGLLGEFPARKVLEVGCNVGQNLTWIATCVEPGNVFGVDINRNALHELRTSVPGVNAVWSPARELPFRDRWFDLTFTMGVLIHQPEESLPLVMGEVVRCSSRWVLCGEYYADQPTEVPYRGQEGALFKRDFGGLYASLFPELVLRKRGFLAKSDAWDDLTWWLFERT